MDQLALSIAAPVVGALLYGWLHHHPYRIALLDRFMYIAVPALVAWQVLPHAWAEYGVVSVGVMLLGLAAPALIERVSYSLAPHTDNVAMVVGISGLALHVLLEGAALASPEAPVSLAVIVHRIPVGLLIWWLVRPRHGFWIASLGIGTVMAATVVGFGIGARLLDEGYAGVELYQAFVGGSLLHTVFHQGRHTHRH